MQLPEKFLPLNIQIEITSCLPNHCPKDTSFRKWKKKKWKLLSCIWLTLCDLKDFKVPARFLCPQDSQARLLEWVAIPFSRGSSWPKVLIQVFCIASRLFTNWAIREATSFRSTSLLLMDQLILQVVKRCSSQWEDAQRPHLPAWLIRLLRFCTLSCLVL